MGDFERKLTEDKNRRANLEAQRETLRKEHLEARSQLDDDIDVEIQNLRGKYDAKLADEREASLRYKGENGIMKKKFTVINQQLEEHAEEIKQRVETAEDLKATMRALEKEISEEKEVIKSRDDQIGVREKKIYELKKKNQELEKFKFVLDYKIKELKRQIEPREAEIADLRRQVEEMDLELEQYHASNAQLDLMIGELRLKLDGMSKELAQQKSLIKAGESYTRKFRRDLAMCAAGVEDQNDLKAGVKELYQRYVLDEDKRKDSEESSAGFDLQA